MPARDAASSGARLFRARRVFIVLAVALLALFPLTGATFYIELVTKVMILEHVWDYSFDPQTNVVDVLVSRLRSKIDPDKTRIETLRGVGYVFTK